MPAFSHLIRRAVLLSLLLLAACSGNTAAPTAATAPVVPTIIPSYQFVPPTQVPRIATVAAATQETGAAEIDPQMLERGRGRYDALECGTCHGANGEGSDDGSPLNDELGMTLAEFISFMRSGGDLGSEHQYASNRLSEGGAANLYQYLLSLNGAASTQ